MARYLLSERSSFGDYIFSHECILRSFPTIPLTPISESSVQVRALKSKSIFSMTANGVGDDKPPDRRRT